MDQELNQQNQPTIVQSSVQTAPVEAKNSYKKAHMIIIGLCILAVVACVSYVLGMFSQKSSDMAINPYLKEIATPLPTKIVASPTPDLTADWIPYTNAKYMYSVKYPSSLTPNENVTYYYFVTFDLPANADGSRPMAPYLISVIPNTFTVGNLAQYNYMDANWITKFINAKVGFTAQDLNSTTFTKLSNVTVDGQAATAVDVTATGEHQERVYVEKNNYLYMFSINYQNVSQPADFQLFLSTIQLH